MPRRVLAVPLANNFVRVASNQVAAPSPPPKEQPSRWWVWDVAHPVNVRRGGAHPAAQTSGGASSSSDPNPKPTPSAAPKPVAPTVPKSAKQTSSAAPKPAKPTPPTAAKAPVPADAARKAKAACKNTAVSQREVIRKSESQKTSNEMGPEIVDLAQCSGLGELAESREQAPPSSPTESERSFKNTRRFRRH